VALLPSEPEDWQILRQLPESCLGTIFVRADTSIPADEVFHGRIRRLNSDRLRVAAQDDLGINQPNMFLWFGPLRSIRILGLWRELFRFAPDALLTVVSYRRGKGRQGVEKLILRFGIWLRLIDFAVIDAGAASFCSSLSPKRYAIYPFSGKSLAGLLEERVAAQQRSVLWVDANLTTKSPSMRSFINSVKLLGARGWNIRGLCYESELSDLEITTISKVPLPWILDLFQFFIACNLYRMVQENVFRRRPAAIVHTTCANDLQAELVSVQFCHKRWLEFSSSSGCRSFREWMGQILSAMYAVLDRVQLRSRNTKMLLPASRAIGDSVRDAYGVNVPQIVLPNAFDEKRFNPVARKMHRDNVREKLGFPDGVSVFAFTSYGHYRRKGFWLIVEALKILGVNEHLRLLVIGGSKENLERLRRELERELPDYSRFILFVGMTNEVEKYLAAADAFLFPSYFEAFCLAEIEAAAMGLPLLVTRHPGTEMILRPGKNGLFLDPDPRDIADKMRRFAAGEYSFELPDTGEALTREAFAARIGEIYDQWLVDKKNANSGRDGLRPVPL
jgi:glycosyltransferase involved in cell wall biosynthesis